MATIRVPVQTSPIPENYCFKGFNSPSWPQLVGFQFVELPSSYPQVVSQAVPAASYQGTHTWLRLDASNRPFRVYWWNAGQWISRHPLPPGSVMMYFSATENAICTFDGGDAHDFADGDAITTDRTGPMWIPITRGSSGITALEFAAPYGARLPIHPGVLNNSDGTVTTIVNKTLSGESQTILEIANLPPHNHGITDGIGLKVNAPTGTVGLTTAAPSQAIADMGFSKSVGDGSAPYPITSMTSKSHNNMPPTFGIWFIQRTNRLYYRGDQAI